MSRCAALPVEVVQLFLVCSIARIVKPISRGHIRIGAATAQRLPEVKRIAEALELVERHDVRRFKRIQRSIKRVFLAPWKSLGAYYPTGRICGVKDFSSEAGENSAAVVLAYAYLLIYGATQGYLHSRRVVFTSGNRTRIQRVCHIEGVYFLRQFPETGSEVVRLLFSRAPR